MERKQLGWLGAALLIGVCVGWFGRGIVQNRYQVVAGTRFPPIKFDTWTGNSWIITADFGWQEMSETPPVPEPQLSDEEVIDAYLRQQDEDQAARQ